MSVELTKAGGDALHRALAFLGIVDDLDVFGQLGQFLTLRADHHDGTAGGAGQDADGAAQQRGPVPLQRRLGRAHPGGPPAGQYHARRTRHAFMLAAEW